MKVWLLGRQANGSQLDEKFKSCQKEWLFVKKKLLATDLPHVNVEEFVSDLDYYYKLLATTNLFYFRKRNILIIYRYFFETVLLALSIHIIFQIAFPNPYS